MILAAMRQTCMAEELTQLVKPKFPPRPPRRAEWSLPEYADYFNDTENCAENAAYIGYAPLSETVYNLLYTEYDYDYDASIFFPYPEGSTREMYHYVSIEHYNKLNDLLDRAKNN